MVVFLQLPVLLLLWMVIYYAYGLRTNDEVIPTVLIDQFTTRSLAQSAPSMLPSVVPSTTNLGTVTHHDDHLSGVTHAPSSSTSSDHQETTITDDGHGHSGTDDTHAGKTTHHASEAHGEVHHSSVFGIITDLPVTVSSQVVLGLFVVCFFTIWTISSLTYLY